MAKAPTKADLRRKLADATDEYITRAQRLAPAINIVMHGGWRAHSAESIGRDIEGFHDEAIAKALDVLKMFLHEGSLTATEVAQWAKPPLWALSSTIVEHTPEPVRAEHEASCRAKLDAAIRDVEIGLYGNPKPDQIFSRVFRILWTTVNIGALKRWMFGR
jgi:hypothetical protein